MAEIGFLLAAGAGIALFDWLGSKGNQQTVTNDITTSMQVSSFYESDTNCSSSVSGSQTIDITSSPGYQPATKLKDDGSSCVLCQNALKDIVSMRDDLEQAAVDASLGRYEAQTASFEVFTAMGGGSTTDGKNIDILGACDLMCNDVVIFGVHQSQVFNAKTDCKIDENVKDDISQSISGKVKSALKNQADVVGQLESAFTSNTEAISNSITSRMSESMTTVVRQQLINNAVSVQNFNAGLKGASEDPAHGGAHSIYVNTVDQAFTSNSVATLNVNNKVNNSLRQSADYSIAQQLLAKNDTIGDISKTFTRTIETMGVFLDELTGDMLIMVGALLFLFVILVGAIYFFSSRGRAFINNLTGVAAQYATGKLSAKTGINFSQSPTSPNPYATSYPATLPDTHQSAFLTSSGFM